MEEKIQLLIETYDLRLSTLEEELKEIKENEIKEEYLKNEVHLIKRFIEDLKELPSND